MQLGEELQGCRVIWGSEADVDHPPAPAWWHRRWHGHDTNTHKHTNTNTYTHRNTYTHMLTHTSITHTLVNVDEFVSVSMVRRRNKKRLDCPAGPKTDNGFRDVLVLSQIIKLKRWTNTTGRSVRCGYCAWLCVHVHVFVFGCPCTHVFVYEVCTGTRCSTLCRSSNVFLCVSACLGVCLFVCVFVCSPCLCMRCAQEQDAPHGVDASGSSQSSAPCPGAPVHMALQCKL